MRVTQTINSISILLVRAPPRGSCRARNSTSYSPTRAKSWPWSKRANDPSLPARLQILWLQKLTGKIKEVLIRMYHTYQNRDHRWMVGQPPQGQTSPASDRTIRPQNCKGVDTTTDLPFWANAQILVSTFCNNSNDKYANLFEKLDKR